MKPVKTGATIFVALGFGAISIILLFIEPGMGFSGPADYFDPAKVLRGAASNAWLVGDLIYLGFGVALAYLAATSDDRYVRASGLPAAVAFFFIGSLGRVLAALPTWIGDPSDVEAAVTGLLPVRFAVLRTAVFALGVFAWRTTRHETPGNAGSAAWRGLGYLVLVMSVAFVFVFIPVPLVYTVWAAWLALRQARA